MRRTTALGAVILVAFAIPAAAQNFQGAYVGVDVGSSSNKTQIDHSLNKPQLGNNQNHIQTINGVAATSGDMTGTSAVFGGQVGYDWRFSMLVVGAQLDMDFWGVNDQKNTRVVVPTNNATVRVISSTDTARASYMMGLRPRVGVVLGESTLVYASAGLVRTDLRYTNSTTISGGNGSFTSAQYDSTTSQKNGTTWGLGVEHVLPNKMGVRLDYQHVQFKQSDVTAANLFLNSGTDLEGSSVKSGYKTSSDIIRLGLTWRF